MVGSRTCGFPGDGGSARTFCNEMYFRKGREEEGNVVSRRGVQGKTNTHACSRLRGNLHTVKLLGGGEGHTPYTYI